ncbi:MAG: CARDB domain-containing protein [Candidatus Micrarchaeota archaeon]
MKTTFVTIVALLIACSAYGFDAKTGFEPSEIPQIEEKDILPTQKVIQVPDGSEMVIDYEKGVVIYEGIVTPIIVDELVGPDSEPVKAQTSPPEGFVNLTYYDDQGNVSFDVYIEDTFYAGNQAALVDFWDKFAPRYEILKNMTGWSAKRWYNNYLRIYVYGHPTACYGGNASAVVSNVIFSDPMYKTGCDKPYYENGTPYYGNPNELGDWWPYMATALHEATHSITPHPIYMRAWLTEGFSEYYMYNVIAESGDINQETADTYLHNGIEGYKWDEYVENDYRDTSVDNKTLQLSKGYDITGWLWSKLRDEHGLDWETFYFLINNNKETLDRTLGLGPPYIYFTDTFILDVFGKAMGFTDFETQTRPLFRYDGPAGPGYGARDIKTCDWYGDLIPTTLVFSNEEPEEWENFNITATVNNTGDVNMRGISARFYDNGVLISEQYFDILRFSSVDISVEHSCGVGGHHIEVKIDEDQIKIELDDTNNNIAEIMGAGFALNLEEFPMYEAQSPYNERTGAAVAQMTLDYMYWNSSQTSTPQSIYAQSWLHDYGINLSGNPTYIDTTGMLSTIQALRPLPYSTYHYNFGVRSSTNSTYVINNICRWVGYTINAPEGHPTHVPSIVPTYGGYTNWMAIRGINTDVDPYPSPENLTVYGFWVNDPYPSSLGGIGENSYKTISEWLSTYFAPLTTGDAYDGNYVSINEPPIANDQISLTLATSEARFDVETQAAVSNAQVMAMDTATPSSVIEEEIIEDVNDLIIQAAIDAVNEELIPFDASFAEAFEGTVPGEPLLVHNYDGADYYLVPFDYVSDTPVALPEELFSEASLSIPEEEAPIEERSGTSVVVIIDAEDGHFKEASWTTEPFEYLPISKQEALSIVPRYVPRVSVKDLGEPIEITELERPTIELVRRSSTPYYPEWKLQIAGKTYYVKQDGSYSPKPKYLPVQEEIEEPEEI